MINIQIYGRDIDKIYDILMNELSGNGMDAITGRINDYFTKIDNLCGIFSKIKYEKDESKRFINSLYR